MGNRDVYKRQMLRGGHDIECFQRKVAEDSLRVAFVTFMLALGIYVTGTTVIAVIEPDTISLQKIMYETASAMATVGDVYKRQILLFIM